MTKRPRPLSPHLSIYKPQITSVLSILHRISGVLNFFITLVLIWFVIIFANNLEGSYSIIKFLKGSTISMLILFVWSYAMCFHLMTGIRHLLWDAGFGFKIIHVYISGWLAVLSATVLWACIWLKVLMII